MPPSVLPRIGEADYPRFQQMIPELQVVTYSEWSDDHKKAIAYRQTRNGAKEIAVLPEEFDSWLKKDRQKAHLELLWVFAESKAIRQ